MAITPVIGVSLGLSFPPYGFWPLSLVALTLLLSITWRLTLRQNIAFWWVSGSSFFLFLIHWLRVVGADAWVAASLALALWWIIAALGVLSVKNLPWSPIWVGSVITTVEILKSRWPWDGFPWGQIAFPLSEGFLGNYLPFVASLGLAWVGATIAASVAWALRPGGLAPRAGRRVWVGVAALLLITPIAIAPFSWGASDKALANQPSSSGGSVEASTIEVAMIQGNVPEIGMDFNARRLAILQNHLRLTETLLAEASTEIQDGIQQARRKLDLVIWPENSSDIDPLADPVVYSEISQVTDRLNVPILVGAVIQDPANQEQVLNAGILWQPKVGPTQKYIKRHPVLFGEFVPFRPLLTRLIGRFDKVPRDFGKGDAPGVFNIGGKPVGDVICFEVADDAVVRDTVRSGAEVLIVQTNNATYNLLGQTEQQLQIGRVRAKEFDRFVLVSATSGISAIVDNHGKVVQEVGEFKAAIMQDTIPLISTQTWSAKFGHSISLLIFALGLTSAFVGFFINFQNRR